MKPLVGQKQPELRETPKRGRKTKFFGWPRVGAVFARKHGEMLGFNRGWTWMDADKKRSRLQAQGRGEVRFAPHHQSGGLAAANHLRPSASIRGQAPFPSRLYMCPQYTFG